MFDGQGVFAASDDLVQELGDGFLLPGGVGPVWKLVFDWIGAIVLLPALALVTVGLLILNPFFNKGPLFFLQDRMGHQCRPFAAFKFRSMSCQAQGERGAFDALETHRITRLGHYLRKMRLDELPQIINVLRGEMSLIGPRPDSLEHARVYVRTVPGYRARHCIRPGISGLAQTEVGYVEDRAALDRKVAADLHYAARCSIRLDLWIAWRTVVVVFGRGGA